MVDWLVLSFRSRELEDSDKSGQQTCELLVVGHLYIVDFDDMLRRRRIKHDLKCIPKKGLIGLRLDGELANIASGDTTLPSTKSSFIDQCPSIKVSLE